MTAHHDVDDLAARALLALEAELVIPPELEARMLGSIPASIEASVQAVPARAAARPAADGPRRRIRRLATLALAAALAAGGAYVGSGWLAARREARAVAMAERDVEHAAAAVAAIDWDDGRPWRDKMAALEDLRRTVSALGSRDAAARFAPRYAEAVRRAFLDAGKARLEDDLRAGTDSPVARDRARAYLLVGDPSRLGMEGAWLAPELSAACAEALADKGVPFDDARAAVRPHLVEWIWLVETDLAPALSQDPRLVARAQDRVAPAPAKPE